MENAKVVIERRVLGGSISDVLQRVAVVYLESFEFRVYAPEAATGPLVDWLPHLIVRRASSPSETPVDPGHTKYIVNLVSEKLLNQPEQPATANPPQTYFHVRAWTSSEKAPEVIFDLSHNTLKTKVLDPYRNSRAIVVNGTTVAPNQLKRIEVYESSASSSQFDEVTIKQARMGQHDWRYFEQKDRIVEVTNDLITTPNIPLTPQKSDAISLLCERFHTVVMQLRSRHSLRPTLDVSDEYDVQDLLHALLRIFFDDVRPEEHTPSHAGKTSRMDFLLLQEETVIETKKTRKGLGAKELSDELIIDKARYQRDPRCKRLVCFVYDPDGQVTNPRGFENDLTEEEPAFSVQVFVSPKH